MCVHPLVYSCISVSVNTSVHPSVHLCVLLYIYTSVSNSMWILTQPTSISIADGNATSHLHIAWLLGNSRL